MTYTIRRLSAEDLPQAFSLIWDTFLEFEAPDYGSEGVSAFRQSIIDNEAFQMACRTGANRIWGAFDGPVLAGVWGMRGPSHICLVFTHKDYHRQGIATAIFQRLLTDVRSENPEVAQLTLNSSPYGKPFYHHIGFKATAPEQTIDGIRFTPMVYPLSTL